MKEYEEKLRDYLESHRLEAEQIRFEQSCHSVREAAAAVGAAPEDLVKNICLLDERGNLIVAIVKGEDKVSVAKVGEALNIIPPRMAEEKEILEKTGYPCGGVPSFSYEATFLIDPKVMEKEIIYTGGGSSRTLVRITSRELQRANNGLVVRIRK